MVILFYINFSFRSQKMQLFMYSLLFFIHPSGDRIFKALLVAILKPLIHNKKV